MRGRPPKAPKTNEPILLQTGDQFRFGPNTRIRANRGNTHPVDPGEQEFIVIATAMTGGGTGHNDTYPDGWEVRAVPIGTPLQAVARSLVRFYQTGAFAPTIMPPPVILTKQADHQTEEMWAGKHDRNGP